MAYQDLINDELSIRTANCLVRENLLSKEDVLNAIAVDSRCLNKIAGLGPKGKTEVLAWLGLGHSVMTEHCIRHLTKLGFKIIPPNA